MQDCILGQTALELNEPSDEAGPPSLMARANAGPDVAMEVLVEEDEIAPIFVSAEQSLSSVYRAVAFGVAYEDAEESSAKHESDF